MRLFKSAKLTLNDVFAWANGLFGGDIPLLPLTGWGATLIELWNKYIIGELPPETEPMPWRIDIEGPWRPFTTCPVTFECLSIVIWPLEEPMPAPPICSLPFFHGSPPSRPRRKAKTTTPSGRKKSKSAAKPKKPSKRPREPAGLLWRTRELVRRFINSQHHSIRRTS
jgi:hypothetical protein